MNENIYRRQADMDACTDISVSLAIAYFSQLETTRTGYSKTLTLPMTIRNREIMGDVDEILSVSRFNKNDHKARIESGGCVIIEGMAFLISCTAGRQYGNQGGYYNMAIIGPGKEWVKKAASMPLRSLGVEWEETVTAAMIAQSWTWDKPVRFLPVQRDKFTVRNHSANIFPPARILTFEDYHPFLHMRTLLVRIFAEAGYSVESVFMDSEYFGYLYMSGNYPRKDSELIRNRMDFTAGRFTSATASADSLGRVYADPYRMGNSLGNIVDTADPDETLNGRKVDGAFSVGGYFRKEDDRVAFVPAETVTIGFEYTVFYTTDYYMESRERLRGFDRVNLEDGQVRQYAIANRNTDRREALRPGRNYTLTVFGHEPGNSYKLCYDADMGGENITVHTTGIFSSRTTSIDIDMYGLVSNPQLYVQKSAGFEPYEDDWAMYDGYVREYGTVEVELTVRSIPERIMPSQPKYFDTIFFGGAEPGMTFTLGDKTTVRPVFAEYPTEGSTLRFEQVAAHEISCLDLINAVKQMFNLRFYTDNLEQKVYVEPYGDFYRKDIIVDWSDKVDFGKPVLVSEPGQDMARTIVFEYQSGDATVAKHNQTNNEKFGQWQARIDNTLAKEQAQAYVNPVFTASLNAAGDFPDAPSARLLQAGER